MLQRSAAVHGRSLRVKAVFATRGTEKQWIRETAAAEIRRSVRSQAPAILRLAGFGDLRLHVFHHRYDLPDRIQVQS